MTSCISPSSTKVFFIKERHVDDSLMKLINLSENASGICQTYCFSFFSVIAIFDTVFLYFVVTLIATAFHVQMSFNCSNSLF